MRRIASFVSVLVLAAGFAVSPAFAQTSEAPTPPANVVEVFTQVTFPTAVPGGADEGSCLVLNATAGDVRVRMDAEVEFADGAVSRLSGISDPGVLQAGGGFELSIFFVVPPDAAIGPAVFRCTVHGQSLETRGRPETEISESAFEVVAP